MTPLPSIAAIVKAEVEVLVLSDVRKPDWRPIADDPELAAALTAEVEQLTEEQTR